MKTSTRFIVPLLLAVLAACGGNPSNPDAGPVTITPEAVTNDWVFVDTIRERTPRARIGHSATVRRGRRVMA